MNPRLVVSGLFDYKRYLIFLAVSVVISIAIQMVLPFPYGLVAVLGLFIAFPLMLRRMSRRESGMGRLFGLNQGARAEIKYRCLVCGNRYNGGYCPRCGSKMKQADF